MGKLQLKLVCSRDWAGKVGMTNSHFFLLWKGISPLMKKVNFFFLIVFCKYGGGVKHELAQKPGGGRSVVKLHVV